MLGDIYSVEQVNNYLHGLVEEDSLLGNIVVEGEVSTVNYNQSGHVYFTLKDGKSSLPAVIFAGNARKLSFKLVTGIKIKVHGKIDVYVPYGKYQLVGDYAAPSGEGDLNAKYEELKKKLEAEGLFSEEHKKPIPRYVTRLGIVTASTGAAVQDIIRVSKERNPYVEIYLYPAKVQGEGAAATIVEGIEFLDMMDLDVIIVGRGGGSLEDLWAFNEEIVARAIYNASTPIISGVGHEPDVALSDYVADVRAATPSNAAEIANFVYRDFAKKCNQYMERMNMAFDGKCAVLSERLQAYLQRLNAVSPAIRIEKQQEKIQSYLPRFDAAMNRHIEVKKDRVPDYARRLDAGMSILIERKRQLLNTYYSRIDAKSPHKLLATGYSFVTDDSGSRITSINDVKKGQTMKNYLADGEIISEIVDVNKK